MCVYSVQAAPAGWRHGGARVTAGRPVRSPAPPDKGPMEDGRLRKMTFLHVILLLASFYISKTYFLILCK